LWLGKSGVTADREFFLGKTGVTADRDKIEFRLFNSSSILSLSAVTQLPMGYWSDCIVDYSKHDTFTNLRVHNPYGHPTFLCFFMNLTDVQDRMKVYAPRTDARSARRT